MNSPNEYNDYRRKNLPDHLVYTHFTDVQTSKRKFAQNQNLIKNNGYNQGFFLIFLKLYIKWLLCASCDLGPWD